MKIKLFAACSDRRDGSHTVKLFNTKQEALDELDRTEEQLESGDTCYYEDGVLEEIVLDIDEKMSTIRKPVTISIE